MKQVVLLFLVLGTALGCGVGRDRDATVDGSDDPAVDTTGDGADAAEDLVDDHSPDGIECSTASDCDDSNPCTVDGCDADFGTCVHEPVDADEDGYPAAAVESVFCGGTDCDDGDPVRHPDAPPDCIGNHDHDCDSRPDRDEDADGHVSIACGGDDCDDDSALAYPGSPNVGCDTGDADCNDLDDSDNDGDGDSPPICGGGDCDDSAPARSSMHDEDPCDGIDTDCDGSMMALEDADGDGYANSSCAASGEPVDCNDSLASVHPGASESCDTVDSDCDGDYSEGGADDDGDTVVDAACGGGDCDDLDPMTYTGATEICSDWIDEDCDGSIDDITATSTATILTSAAGESGYCFASWTGSEIGLAWHDERDGNFEIYFARLSPSGTVTGSESRITNASAESWEPAMAWSGSEFGIAWEDQRDGNFEIYFARLSATGVKQGADLRVTIASGWGLGPAMAWSGSHYGIAWGDARDGNNEIYFARISAAGVKQGADLRLTNASGDSTLPSVAWTGSEYALAWYDNRDGNYEIYFSRISAGGSEQGGDTRITNDTRASEAPWLAWNGSELALAWNEARDLNPEIYFLRLSPTGAEIGLETRVTFSTGDSLSPAIAWTGSGYIVAWNDGRDGNPEVYFAALSPAGAKSGTDLRMTSEAGDSLLPVLAWTGSSAVMAWHDAASGNYEVYVATLSHCE